MELYIKPGPDGNSVGDCPFAHYVRAVIHTKKLDCKVFPCCAESKPTWLLEKHQGKMPCLRDGNDEIVESSMIVAYLETTYPDIKVECPADKEMMQSTSGLFPALAKFIKKAEYDESLEHGLKSQLDILESRLNTSSGDYLCGGDTASLVDLSLAPKLYHLRICLQHFYPNLSAKLVGPKVTEYTDRVLQLDAVRDTSYPPETVIAGWTKARGQ